MTQSKSTIRRWSTIEFKSQAKVLLIDDEQELHSRYIALALNPGRMTGIKSEIHTKEFLRNASLPKLNEFETIFLLNVDTFESSAVENLESYVASGGGLALFCGPEYKFRFLQLTTLSRRFRPVADAIRRTS